MLDGIVVLNDPVNWVDPWGLHGSAGPMPGNPCVMSCHPSENGTTGGRTIDGTRAAAFGISAAHFVTGAGLAGAGMVDASHGLPGAALSLHTFGSAGIQFGAGYMWFQIAFPPPDPPKPDPCNK